MTALPGGTPPPVAPFPAPGTPVGGRDAADDEAATDLTLDPVARAVDEIAAGRPVVVVDDEQRENEGDLVAAADAATPELLAFMMSECRGLICAPMDGADLDRLALPPMVRHHTEPMGTAFTVSVDAAPHHGVSTGIAAADRATTLRLLADPTTVADDLVRPGHVFPLRAHPAGVLARRGHTEAGVDLARLAGRRPAAVIVEIAAADGSMLRLPRLVPFARRHGLAIVSIADLVAYRRAADPGPQPGPDPVPGSVAGRAEPPVDDPSEPSADAPAGGPADEPVDEPTGGVAPKPATATAVRRVARAALPTAHGPFQAYGYRAVDGTEHVALVVGDLGDGEDVLVRMHSECLTGDAFDSQRCDCGPQLASSLARVQAEGRGVVLYLRGHEGRGIGLLAKLRAYELQERGRDTLDANLELGLPADARDYAAGAGVLADLGVRSVRLLTNNPAKAAALARHGMRLTGREPMPVRPGVHNLRYLRTKRDRMGHDLPWLADADLTARGTGTEG